jgi:hypothetical protein
MKASGWRRSLPSDRGRRFDTPLPPAPSRGNPAPADSAAAPDGDGDGGAAGSAPARNLRIGLVEVSQSVFIRLGEGAMLLEPGQRNAELIEGRPMMVRVHVLPAAGFMPRPLRGQLAIVQADAAGEMVLQEQKTISAASVPEKLETTFNFLVPAPAAPPRFPPTGDVDLAVKPGRMVLDVVMVPAMSPAARSTLPRPAACASRTTFTTSIRCRS